MLLLRAVHGTGEDLNMGPHDQQSHALPLSYILLAGHPWGGLCCVGDSIFQMPPLALYLTPQSEHPECHPLQILNFSLKSDVSRDVLSGFMFSFLVTDWEKDCLLQWADGEVNLCGQELQVQISIPLTTMLIKQLNEPRGHLRVKSTWWKCAAHTHTYTVCLWIKDKIIHCTVSWFDILKMYTLKQTRAHPHSHAHTCTQRLHWQKNGILPKKQSHTPWKISKR